MMTSHSMRLLHVCAGLAFFAGGPASAERITNPVAVFVGLNKITGLTTNFEANVGQAAVFGSFTIKTLVCYSRPITEAPKTTAFIEIDSREPSGEVKRIFSGWMFAESPGLNAVEHPVLDVWLTGCRDPNAPPPPVETQTGPENTEKEEEVDPLD
jgi:hypothetical protein